MKLDYTERFIKSLEDAPPSRRPFASSRDYCSKTCAILLCAPKSMTSRETSGRPESPAIGASTFGLRVTLTN